MDGYHFLGFNCLYNNIGYTYGVEVYIYKGRRKKPCQRDRRLYIYPIQAFLEAQTPRDSINLTYVLPPEGRCVAYPVEVQLFFLMFNFGLGNEL